MENNLNDKYLKLIEEEQISINKDLLMRLVDPEYIKSEQSYKILENLGGVNSLLSRLNINPLEGLDEEDANDIKKRKQLFGTNNPVIPFNKNFLDCFFEILNQKIFLILIFAATVRLLIDLFFDKGRWFDYSSIYISVLIICLAMSIIEFSKEKVFENFHIDINNKMVRVLRNGEEKLISQKDLLVGDILILNAGENIPVDGLIIKAFSVTIDTEDTIYSYHNIDYLKQKLNPAECDKFEFPFILSGSYVIKGYAYILILCVGSDSYINKITIERYKNTYNGKKNHNLNSINDINDDEEKEFEIGTEQENLVVENKNTPNSFNMIKDFKNSKVGYNYSNNYNIDNNDQNYKSEDFSNFNNLINDKKEIRKYSLYDNNYTSSKLNDLNKKIDINNFENSNKNKDQYDKSQYKNESSIKSKKLTFQSITKNSNFNEDNTLQTDIKNYNDNLILNDNENSKNKVNFDKFRSILRKSQKIYKNYNTSFNNQRNSTNNFSSSKEILEKIIKKDNLDIEKSKDIIDYAEEFHIFNQTKKNSEIKSGFFRNKSNVSLNNFKKKEIVNVRSQDKRYTVTEIFYYSPLQKKIESVELILSKFGIVASVISGISYLLFYIILSYPENFLISEVIQIIIDATLYGLVLIVLAIPEGLPLASTLSAAFSINKMKEENTIVKSIQACEYMATINCICTDFNGVFTKNEMKVTKIFIEDKLLDDKQIRYLRAEIANDSFEFLCEAISIHTIAYAVKNKNTFQLEFFGDSVETSLIKLLKDIKVDYRDYRYNKKRPILECSPYSTDINVCYTIIEMDGKYDQVRLYLRGNCEDLLDCIFNFITHNEVLSPVTPKFKEKLKKICKDVTKEGNLPILICYRDIQKDYFYKIRQAYLHKESEFIKSLITQLNLISVICLKDEIREDVKTYIQECNKAGIIVKMITSQDKETAKIAAEKCGILNQNIILRNENSSNFEQDSDLNNSDEANLNDLNEYTNLKTDCNNTNSDIIYTEVKQFNLPNNTNFNNSLMLNNSNCNFDILDCHEDLKKLIDLKLKKKNLSITNSYHSFEFLINDINKFEKIIQNSKVISKATAKDKYILVSTLKKNGYIVAVTGDSASDFLAMKSAHVSISMGYKASDMSKESADIILCDNSFKNILTGIIYGRNIYNSVRKFIQFQITATVSIVSLALICSLPMINFYFYPNQLLWLNLVQDTLGSISLASEQPNKEEVMSKKPCSNKKNIISRSMKIRIYIQAILQIIIIMIMVFISPFLFNIESDRYLRSQKWQENNGIHTTVVFTCLVYLQFFNAFISRNLDKDNLNIFKNLSYNKIFLILQILMIFLHYIIITYGSIFIRSKPLPLVLNLLCFIIASSVLLTLPIIKYFSNNRLLKFIK